MISLLNFIDAGFVITLGLLILISSAILVYCYRRLNILEDSVIEHGRILQNFIINYNTQMQHHYATQQSNSLNSDLATNDSDVDFDNINQQNIKQINLENKINVSENSSVNLDDDEDDDDSDNASDSENDNASDSENDNESDVESDNEINNEDNNNSKDNENSSDSDSENANDTITTNELVIDENDDFLNNIPINISELDLNTSIGSKIINLTNLDNNENIQPVTEKKNYNKMKVDDLRILAVTNNLLSNDDAQTTKKADLIKLIANQ